MEMTITAQQWDAAIERTKRTMSDLPLGPSNADHAIRIFELALQVQAVSAAITSDEIRKKHRPGDVAFRVETT
jgi:hypothetical protein